MSFEIDECLRYLVKREGSDLHLKVGSPPMTRIHGGLSPLEDEDPLEPEDTESALRKLMSDDRTRDEFAADGEADFSYQLEGISRFRVNAFRQRGAVSIVCRAIPFQVRTIDDLGLPPVIRKLADEQRGIILLTGTTGSGKTTTLAAMIDHINSTYSHHIITLEDPIEYLHRDKRSIINQREVGADTQSFSRAMRRVLRQDPDVILVGEMRDEETVRTALSAAETGHLVLSTLHTLDATETINRIIDFFPPHLQQQARVMLAGTLKGAVSQRLVPTVDGNGRVAASEIMVVTGRVQDLIMNPLETGKISQVIAEGDYYGMQTFDQSLLKHVAEGRVLESTAMDYASSPHDFKLMLASSGRQASDLSQMSGAETGGETGSETGGETGGETGVDDGALAATGAPLGATPPAAAPEPAPAAPNGDPAEAPADPAPNGTPEYDLGRSLTPTRPVAEPDQPVEADQPVEPDQRPEPATPAAAATGETGSASSGEDTEHGQGEPGHGRQNGLGSADFNEVWGDSGSATTPLEPPAPPQATPPAPPEPTPLPAPPQATPPAPSEPTPLPAPPRPAPPRRDDEDRLAEFRPERFDRS
jgi:twitching motility protein PilT